MVFINCVVENPSFDSQTKDFMSTPVAKFGSSCNISDAFIDKIAKMGVMNTACELTNIKSTKNAKKTHCLGMIYYVNFLGGLGSNKFHIK